MVSCTSAHVHSIVTPHACARGKVIGYVRLSVGTKNASSLDPGRSVSAKKLNV